MVAAAKLESVHQVLVNGHGIPPQRQPLFDEVLVWGTDAPRRILQSIGVGDPRTGRIWRRQLAATLWPNGDLRRGEVARDRLSSNPGFPLNFAQGPAQLAQCEDLLSLRIAQDVAHSCRSTTASSHWSTSQRSTGRFCRDHDWPDLGDHRGL